MTELVPDAGLPPAPASARELCGHAFERVEAFARLLAAEGPTLGLVGPREVPRLWERHVLNCAAVTPLVSGAGRVVDVGSGAGLPGVVVACLLPDTPVTLLEPMLRRSTWLSRVVAALELDQVEVVRARAEDMHGKLAADVVMARAVAPLAQLAGWCLPLLGEGGRLLALKGESAAGELARDRAALGDLGVWRTELVELGSPPLEVPTRVVVVEGGLAVVAPRRRPGRKGR